MAFAKNNNTRHTKSRLFNQTEWLGYFTMGWGDDRCIILPSVLEHYDTSKECYDETDELKKCLRNNSRWSSSVVQIEEKYENKEICEPQLILTTDLKNVSKPCPDILNSTIYEDCNCNIPKKDQRKRKPMSCICHSTIHFHNDSESSYEHISYFRQKCYIPEDTIIPGSKLDCFLESNILPFENSYRSLIYSPGYVKPYYLKSTSSPLFNTSTFSPLVLILIIFNLLKHFGFIKTVLFKDNNDDNEKTKPQKKKKMKKMKTNMKKPDPKIIVN